MIVHHVISEDDVMTYQSYYLTTEYYTEGSLHQFSYDFDVTAFRSKFLASALKRGRHPLEKFKMAAMFRSGKTAVQKDLNKDKGKMRTQYILFFEKLESNIFYICIQIASHGKCVYSNFMQALCTETKL